MGKNFNKHKHGKHNHRGNKKERDFKRPDNRHNSNTRYADRRKYVERPPQIPRVTLKEPQVGIIEYVGSSKGFTGVLKSRFSDFHVNEIDRDGNILVLTDFNIPQPEEPESDMSSTDVENAKGEVSDVVTEEIWKQIDDLAKNKRAEEVEIDVTALDKEKRTLIHKVIKKLYEMECNSKTKSKEDDKKSICIARMDKNLNRRNKWSFPGEYVHFLVYKENMDTSEVAVILANGLKLKPSQVNYCGTKDKRGITTQKFCVKRRLPAQIVNSIRRISSVKVGNFSFHQNVLKLGDLKGNRFRIVLRHVEGDRDEIEKSLQSVKEYGFLNYYGLQRFGNNASIPTYKVGVALLKSDYKTACELILKPRENDLPFMRDIRAVWWRDRNSAAAAAMFHNDRMIEKKLLDGLAHHGENDYANALRKIPRNILILYTHAYQSLIFNRVASKRIKEHGSKLIVGDLVYRNQDELDQAAETTDELVDPDDLEDDTSEDNKEEESAFKQKVKSLTEDDISSGKYTIFDIVLPLPGHDITYPDNEVGQWYEDILAEENLSSEKLKHGVKTYSLAGAYRKLFVQPQNMSWYFKKYNTPVENVIPSHFEKETDAETITEGKGQFTALVLDFCLPASVYATMFIREVLKADTSATNQANIAKAEMEKHEEKNQENSADALEEGTDTPEVSQEKKTAKKRTEEETETAEEGDEEPDAKKAKEDSD